MQEAFNRKAGSSERLYVFAYGSNLFQDRMTGRVPSAEVIAVGTLPRHALRFHMHSTDGSGKADAFFTGRSGDGVVGVLYRLEADHIGPLDVCESGYTRKLHTFRIGRPWIRGAGLGSSGGDRVGGRSGEDGVGGNSGEDGVGGNSGEDGVGGNRDRVRFIDAWTYHARPERIRAGLRPYSWYHRYVLEGARSHGIAPEYLERIERIEAVPDRRTGIAATG